jgi:cytochrome o ubiquinol oxidase operon protein cyoD
MGTYKSYITGFVLSVILTLAAYFAVVSEAPKALVIILLLAIAQLFVQLIFFLHLLSKGSNRGWNLAILISAFSIILILVIGSIWIMNHLNYNMTPQDINNYMSDQSGGV